MSIIINPGSGPVAGATLEQADANMQRFVLDVEEIHDDRSVTYERGNPAEDHGGRFSFTLSGEQVGKHEIDMPGIPLVNVRYISAEGQNIWDFPRLYVDGSSWVWCYAVNAAGPDDEDES